MSLSSETVSDEADASQPTHISASQAFIDKLDELTIKGQSTVQPASKARLEVDAGTGGIDDSAVYRGEAIAILDASQVLNDF